MKNNVIDLVGWYGVCAILTAYILATFSFMDIHGYTYQLLNITGAAAIIIEAGSKRDYQPVVLNSVWALVALIAILRSVF